MGRARANTRDTPPATFAAERATCFMRPVTNINCALWFAVRATSQIRSTAMAAIGLFWRGFTPPAASTLTLTRSRISQRGLESRCFNRPKTEEDGLNLHISFAQKERRPC